MQEEENTRVDLKQFKGHHRKFPWSLIIRLVVMGISIALIFFLIKFVAEVQEKKADRSEGIEIEFE